MICTWRIFWLLGRCNHSLIVVNQLLETKSWISFIATFSFVNFDRIECMLNAKRMWNSPFGLVVRWSDLIQLKQKDHITLSNSSRITYVKQPRQVINSWVSAHVLSIVLHSIVHLTLFMFNLLSILCYMAQIVQFRLISENTDLRPDKSLLWDWSIVHLILVIKQTYEDRY